MKKAGQRESMLELIEQYRGNKQSVIAAYARAERRGEVAHESNKSAYTPEQYARRLWQDGIRKGWITAV
jgi:hypothetical protein